MLSRERKIVLYVMIDGRLKRVLGADMLSTGLLTFVRVGSTDTVVVA